MMQSSIITCDLLVIGTGTAGMAAALFAANRGIHTAHVGMTGQINFASGLLDLMGVHPGAEKKWWKNPWEAIEAVVRDIPEHPYSRIRKAEIQSALTEFTAFLTESGFPYEGYPEQNAVVFTAVGTVKPTFLVPQSMWQGVKAFEKKSPCLIFDFQGLKGFSARQIQETLSTQWPALRSERIVFPNTRGGIYPEHMARMLEEDETRDKLIDRVATHIKDEQFVGFPAIMGISRTREILSHMEEQLGLSIFEIPTMPPSITGIRLRKTFERHLPQRGVRPFYQKHVLSVQPVEDGFLFDIGNQEKEVRVKARGAILASGRFFGKGLAADRKRIRETIFNLPVFQPESREFWHRKDFFDPLGHDINQAGLKTDPVFRPLDSAGKPAFLNLYAAGSILAHQDWMRMKCGSGLAIATAYGAVNGFLKLR
jgi:glycerol-3-phosphate dehydrogenase subunit B